MVRVIKSKSLYQRIKSALGGFKLFALLGVTTLAIGLTFYLTTQQQDLRQRASDSSYVQNQYLRIWDSRFLPGVIDLFYIDANGTWQQYNNIVPIARVNGVWANAELDKATITREYVSNDLSQQQAKYQFSPLSNGAHFYLLMTLKDGASEVQFQIKTNSDSAPIEAIALGNYYGYAHLVRYLKINNTTYDALTYPKPDPDGNYTLGRFTRYEFPTNNRVEFWGENGFKQFQYVDIPLSFQDEMVSEIRYTPWLPTQTPPGKNWFETVHITRSPFDDSKSVWHFGYQASPPPTTFPTPTIARNPTTTPTPTPQLTGWKGEYYSNTSLFGTPKLTRMDPEINFNWGQGSPSYPTIGNDGFSVRWSKTEYFSGGNYKVNLSHDDGIKIYVDGSLKYSKWYDQGASTISYLTNVAQGNHNLVVEYYENRGSAVAKVTWTKQ